jgi:hypothetical protein
MAGPITAMTGLDPKVSKPPDVEIMPRACRRAPFQHEPYDAAAVQWPNRPHETNKSPCNVVMKVRIDNDSQIPYCFWQPGSVIIQMWYLAPVQRMAQGQEYVCVFRIRL